MDGTQVCRLRKLLDFLLKYVFGTPKNDPFSLKANGRGPMGPMGKGPMGMGPMGQGPMGMGPWARAHGPNGPGPMGPMGMGPGPWAQCGVYT